MISVISHYFEHPLICSSIVAVHGIGAHPVDAWQHRKTKANWLSEKKMLPAKLPRARIMSYGYQSYWFGDDAVKTSIDGVATKLLQDLKYERKLCRDRPLLLVGHCFGGLVIQKVRMPEQIECSCCDMS